MSIAIITTGGTIDKNYFDALSEYKISNSPINNLLTMVNVNIDFHINSLMKKDSLEITDSEREQIFNHIQGLEESKVLITHGTDTMALTAEFLIPIPGKTVVLTGAMKPARFKDSDAAFNIGFALGALQTLPFGIYIAMNGQVFKAGEVVKNRAKARFENK